MDKERWQRIFKVVDEALEHAPEKRAAFIKNACPDAELRLQAQHLLDDSQQGECFLERPLFHFDDPPNLPQSDSVIGRHVGPYKLLKELGKGGMGRVYLAERADGQYERKVALKIVYRGVNRDEILRRFRKERQILANLKHPNIAVLYDGGSTDGDRPYFVLEYGIRRG